jgi:putative hydrolase of the HAD superfamily
MTTHLVFDFFGTLVSYSSSRTDQGYERSFDLLRDAGSRLGYQEFLSLWSEVSAGFDESALRSNCEFSMLESRFTLSIITNTHDPDLVPRHLERMGVAHLFKEVVTSVEFGIRKPAVEIFDHTLGLLGTSTENCVYVGDNYEADFVGARSAGIRAFLIDPLASAAITSEDRLSSILEIEKKLVGL